MSIIPARRIHHKIIRDAVPNSEAAWQEEQRSQGMSGPVTALQGPASGGRRMRKTITCKWCWEPLEEGSMFRLRRNFGANILAHVSCSQRRRPK